MASSITSTFSSAATNSSFYPTISTYSVTIPASGAIDSNLGSGVLSGTATVFNGSIALTLSAVASAAPYLTVGSIVLTIGSKYGNNTYNGYLRGSTFNPQLSVATFSIGFQGSDFISTNIGLSANKTSIVIDSAYTPVIDVPFINVGSIDNDASSNVSYIHTVADFCRQWNLNG
ncbi:MAG: hypothetical protein EB127_14115 [Alphaproteobacteria bacterium]|nr:hypothetical protein [Alphaproteobacteria bacterium]